MLPGAFAWPAGLGDIAIGVTAPWVARALVRRPGFAISRVFVVWNLLGILDLVVGGERRGLSSALPPGAPGEVTTGPVAQLPLVLIPAYLVPLFVILHLATFQRVLAGVVDGLGEPAWLVALANCGGRSGRGVRRHYAMRRRATTGITKINVLLTHQIALVSPRTRPFAPMIAAPNAARPSLVKAISSAINPRARHPSTSTGVEATTKKAVGMMAGIIM